MSFIKELKRRNVLRVGAAYLAGAWLLIQLINEIFPLFGIEDSVSRIVVVLLAIGFAPVLVISWLFEWTPKGLERDSGEEYQFPENRSQTRSFDRIIIVVLSLAVTFFAVHSFVIDPMRDAEDLQKARLDSFDDKSVAILPCADLSENSDQEYFADGIAEELLNVLSQLPELRVPGRASAFSFKGSNATIREIANTLNVAHVLECSVRRTGQQLRITTQLIDAMSDTRLWAKSYDLQMGDIFAIQDEIAGQVVNELEISLLGAPPHVDQTTPKIFELHALAGFILDDRVFERKEIRLTEIRERLEQAIVDDPDYFPIRWQLARVYNQLNTFRQPAERQELHTLRDELCLATYEHFPDRPEAIALYMVERLNNGFYAEAALEIQRSLETDPDNLFALASAAYVAENFHRPKLVVEIQEYIVSRDPVCAHCRNVLLGGYYFAREYEKARLLYEESTAFGLTLGSEGLRYYARTLLALGDFEAALEAFQELEDQRGRPPFGSAIAKFYLGQEEEFEQQIAQFTESLGENHFVIAMMYVETGQLDLAIEIINTMSARDVRSIEDPALLERLREHPRWQEIAERSGIWPDPRRQIPFDIEVPKLEII